jgi:hypothetical protein
MIGKVQIAECPYPTMRVVFRGFEGNGTLTCDYHVDAEGRTVGSAQVGGEPAIDLTDEGVFERAGVFWRIAVPKPGNGLTTCHLQKLDWVSLKMVGPKQVKAGARA